MTNCNNILFKYFLPFAIFCCYIHIHSSYSWEVQNSYKWKLYKNDTLLNQGFLDAKFKAIPIETFDILSEYQEYLTGCQHVSACLDRELLGALREFCKLTIETSPSGEPLQGIDDPSLFIFFNYNTHIYSTLNIMSSPTYRKRSVFTEMIFLFSCCCFYCDERFCRHCGYNKNAEKNLIEASLVKRNNLTYNMVSRLDLLYINNSGEEIKISNKIEPSKIPVINIFIFNDISIKWISKILSNQLQTNETLVIIPFNQEPVRYKIYTHKYPEIKPIDNNIAPTHKIIFTDLNNPNRKLVLHIHRKSIETVLLLSCEYSTETNYLLRINHGMYNDEIYQFPPAYEEIPTSS